MTEEHVKNRGWVKNAAIIFLAVMLVLTFFSNHFMNRSLPEVSAQYAIAGSITTQIRGTGAVEATETFEVKTDDVRKVKSVLVRVGQEVSPGDLLFVLAEGDGADLEAAKAALTAAQYDYQVALINAGDVDNNGENSEIIRAREKLEAAIKERDSRAGATEEAISNAKTDLAIAKTVYDTAVEKLEAAGGAGGGGGGGDYSSVTAAQNVLNEAKTALDAAKIQYQRTYEGFRALAEWLRTHEGHGDYSLESYMEYLASMYAPAMATTPPDTGSTSSGDGAPSAEANPIPAAADGQPDWTKVTVTGVDVTTEPGKVIVRYTPEGGGDDMTYPFDWEKLIKAYNGITEATTKHNNAQTSYNSALNAYYNSFTPSNSALSKKVREAKAAMDASQEFYDNLVKKQDEYKTAVDQVFTNQDALEKAIIGQKLETLDLQRKRQDIATKQTKVNELSGESGAGGEVHSDVYGVVKAINVTAGNNADPNTAMATIEVPDRGYSVSLSVTTEQAKKVSVGDSATVSTGYWGDSGLTGRLSAIKTDPKKPTTNKLLVFEITGDVESGAQVTVSIGQRSQNFDVIIPNSAVREDSNGKFVYIVAAKSSPLGNRYVATRVDIQVIASDDTNSAVSGGLSSGDFVITNSTKPIEKGMLVRIADNG